MSKTHDLVVIGSGIAGLSAARQALESGLSTLTLESLLYGGLVTNINELDGEIQGSGIDLASSLMMKVRKLGAEHLPAGATSMTAEGEDLVVHSDTGAHRASAVIIASGARLRRLGVPGESEFEDKGVSHCADCDGPYYQDRDVVVVGGGDSALQEALVLSAYAKRVHLLHRGEHFRARRHFTERILGSSNISVQWRTRVEAVLGGDAVQAVRVRNLDSEAVDEIACAGFFAYVGLEPACGFVPDAVLRDRDGALLTDAGLRTAMPGVFAAGAVRSGYGGLLTGAVAEGRAAAKSALAMIRS
ncbi:MAG: FAD-dependent oxidoreductase [Burkholderiales bacterium]|nr:FAD-dependent oxidoreductase [Burkholderiales bacterium]